MVRKGRMVNGQVFKKTCKDEMTFSIEHQFHGQKGQNGQWTSVQKDIKI